MLHEPNSDTARGQSGLARPPGSTATRDWLRRLYAARWVVAAVLLSASGLFVFRESGTFLAIKWMIGWVGLLPWLYLIDRLHRAGQFRGPQGNLRRLAPLLVMTGGLLLLLFSSAVQHKWFFFLNWAPASDGDYAGLPFRLGAFILLTGLLTPLVLTQRPRIRWWVMVFMLAAQAVCFRSLMQASGGHALARDDHPSMLFRLWEFSQTWPQLVNYNPYWNGGVVDFAGTASGLNGLGLLLKPVLAFARLEDVYTPFIGVAFIGLAPLLAALSVRVAGGRGAAPWVAGILGLGVSQQFFLWLLQFGTVGACFSTVFILPFAACVFRALWLRGREWWLGLLMVTSFAFLLMWPPGGLMALTVAGAALVNLRRWTWKRVAFLAVCGVLGLAVMAKPLALLVTESGRDLTRPLAPQVAADAGGAAYGLAFWKAGWARLVDDLRQVNPILSFLGLLGAAVFPRRSVRWWFLPIFAGLALMCGWGALVRKDLELNRMAMALAMVAIAPAALAIERVLRTGRFRLAFVRAALLALLVMTALSMRDLYLGRQPLLSTRYLGSRTASLVALLREKAVPGSRVLFAGPCVHGYGDGGHVAALPYLSGIEMMACDYFHFPTSEVEYEYPPRPFRGDAESLFRFLQAYNVNLIVTRDRPKHRNGVDWMERLLAEPERYRKIAAFDDGQVIVFRVAGERFPMVLAGRCRVEAAFNRIRVETAHPEDRTIIKYNWQPGLKVAAPVRIRPYTLAPGYELIEIEWNGQNACTIRFDRGW